MNIAVNATIIDEKPTGLGVYALNVVNELSKLTGLHVVTSYAGHFNNNPNIKIIKAPGILQPKNKKIGAVARVLWLNMFLPCILNRHKIDLLMNLTHHGLFFSKIHQVMTVHDLIPLKFASQYRFQNYYYRFLLPFLIQRAEAVNTCTESTKRDILKFYDIGPEKIIVSGNGFNFLGETAPAGKEKNYILMVGASFRHKNCHSVLEAYKRSGILQKYTMVIGGGQRNYLNYLRALSRKLGVQDSVRFIEYVNQERLSYLYANAKVFVYPSLYEGFGMPPLEAMQAGIPVVASGIDPIVEVCGEAAVYCSPDSIDDIKEKIETAVQDEKLRDGLRQAGFRKIKKYGWNSVAKRIYDFIRANWTGESRVCSVVNEGKTVL